MEQNDDQEFGRPVPRHGERMRPHFRQPERGLASLYLEENINSAD